MAHFEKYTKAQSRQVLQHDARQYTDARDNIDKEATVLNYNLAECSDPWQMLKQAIEFTKEGGARFNSRTVALASCVVTLPKGFDGDPHLFFAECKKHLDKTFGSENCISCWVHFDEPGAQPHMHYKAMPLCYDKSKNTLQFNCKRLLNRGFLQRFHGELNKHLHGVFGRDVGILNGATTKGNQTVEQLKALTEAKEEFEKVMSELQRAKQTLQRTLHLQDVANRELREVYKSIEEAEGRLAKLRKECFTFENEDFSPVFENMER